MTATDLVVNIFYKFRFWLFRNFFSRKIQRISTPSKDGWELTFEDDFNEISWAKDDTKKWRVSHGWGEFHPDYPFAYHGPPELVKGTSCARFSVVYDPKTYQDDKRTGKPITISFRKSLITTDHSFRQQYGRFECRCQIPYDRGAWPAFWLWAVNDNRYSEIDIFELYGNKDGSTAGVQQINLHYGDVNKKPWDTMRAWKVKITNPEPIGLLHEFAMEWSPGKIECFTDGVKIFRYTRKEVLDQWFGKDNTTLWIIQNHSIDPEFVKQEDKDYYSEYLVDYVRAYKRKT